jgi:glycosyltransferase involved in cell wall biosynthesis
MMPPARCLLVELDEPVPSIDWGLSALWRIIATAGGVPCWGGWIVSPGRLHDPEAFLQLLLREAREHARALALTGDLQRAFGIETAAGPRQTVSVVVCTHRRSHYLPGLLEALSKLAPPPAEVIVVDNDPGDEDCRDLVLRHGARYVREDRRGLNHGRAAGLRTAIGTVVAYTDDDCVPPPRWLARVDGLFADPSVDAVTGPAFAYELATPSQLRFELEGGFNRGFTERRFDWTTTSPGSSGAVGAGANMMFRRDRLLALGEVFPPELDAGTASQTGGDQYALYRVLDGGSRVVYDPGCYVFHRHRREPQALAHAFLGYGTGIVAASEKLIVQRRDPEALLGLRWLWSQYREALIHSLLGQRDKRSLRVAAYYFVGGLTGVGKWRRARAQERARSMAPKTSGSADAATPSVVDGCQTASVAMASAPAALPAEQHGTARAATVSVIVPTIGRSSQLAEAIWALPRPGAGLEVIVVDDRHRPSSELNAALPAGVHVIRSGGVGAAAARNLGARHATGEILVFMDDDLIAGDDLIRHHLASHEGRTDVFMIGYSLPEPVGSGWAARAAALWWHDHFRALTERRRVAPTDMLSGNVSIRRDRFWELGGFSESFGRLRREDWLFGASVLRAGLEVRFGVNATARHRYTLTTAGRLRAAAAEGLGDALLASVDPEFAAILPADAEGRRAPIVMMLARLLARKRVAAAAVGALDGLERLRLRRQWLTMFHRAQRLAYLGGRRRGDQSLGRVHTRHPARRLVVGPDLTALDFEGLFAPDLVVDDAGRERVLRADLGRWTTEHARRAARTMAANDRRRARAPSLRADGLRVAIVVHRARVDEAVITCSAAEGVPIHQCQDDESLWRRAADVAASGAAAVVWVVMPQAVLRSGIAAELRCLSDGDRVAVTVATPGKTCWRHVHDARLDSRDWLAVGSVPAIIGFRPEVLDRIGPLDLAAEPVGGSMGPGLELAHRALHAKQLMAEATVAEAHWEYHRLRPWRNAEWQRQRARGGHISTGEKKRRATGMIQAGATILLMGGSLDRRVRSRAVALGGLAHGAIMGVGSAIRRDQGGADAHMTAGR